jgi:hypothetical protein
MKMRTKQKVEKEKLKKQLQNSRLEYLLNKKADHKLVGFFFISRLLFDQLFDYELLPFS